MKLNAKGLHKIQQWQSAVALGFPMRPSEIEFESDDFQNMMNFNNEKTLPNINSQITLNGKEIKIIYNLLEEFTDTMNTSEYDVFKKLEKHLYEPKKDNDYDIEIECEIQNL